MTIAGKQNKNNAEHWRQLDWQLLVQKSYWTREGFDNVVAKSTMVVATTYYKISAEIFALNLKR